MGADTADGSGQGDLVLDDFHSLLVVAVGDSLDISLDIGTGGAVQMAG